MTYDYNKIFKSYDVRGIVPKELNSEMAYAIGRAFVEEIKCNVVYIGHDMRVSSKDLHNALVEGITDAGCNVISLGLVSTDMAYYASGKYNAPAIMITASHNPKEYNGIKFCKEGAQAISYDGGLKQIKERAEKGFSDAQKAQKGSYEAKDILNDFLDTLIDKIDVTAIKPMTIAVDAGNGMAGLFMPRVAEKIPQIKLVPLFFELDGTFPNHPANPIDSANVQDLIKKIKEVNADIGLAFDGDADRVYLVDDAGVPVSASITTAMTAKALLLKSPSSTVIHNVVCSWIVPEIVKKYGGTPFETKVGHSIIKPIMREKQAIFGGEHSGHYYFKDLYYADSGLLAALYILELLSKAEGTVSDVLNEFRKYYAIEETNVSIDDKDAVLSRIIKRYKDADGVVSYKDFDGIRVDFKEWWFNVRPSNTEPLLRLNLEAVSPELVEEKKAELLALMKG